MLTTMTTATTAERNNDPSGQPVDWQVDFVWSKCEAKITPTNGSQSQPSYKVRYGTAKPHLTFEVGNQAFATSSIHVVSINADCVIHDKPTPLKALKRLHTRYTHRSNVFARDDGSAMDMIWTATCGWKYWVFECRDEYQEVVATLSANMWACKNLATMKITGPRSSERMVQDELIVMAYTLCFCMMVRCNNPLSLLGAAFGQSVKADSLNSPSKSAKSIESSESDEDEHESSSVVEKSGA